MRNVLAMPVIVGRKTAKERFAGAANTMTCEGIMRDGKALQMGTSHELGQRFSRAFNISYSSAEGTTELCWTTSWGASTRMLGGLIMCHGDDFGLVLPPALAPVQAVVVVVKDTDGVRHPRRLGTGRRAQGAWRAGRDWTTTSLKDSAGARPSGTCRVCRSAWRSARAISRRTRRCSTAGTPARSTRWSLGSVVDEVRRLAGRIQGEMLEAATARRDAFISDCTTLDDAREVAQTGVARVPWESVGAAGEAGSRRRWPDRAVSAARRRIAARDPMTTPARSPISPGPTERGSTFRR